MSTQEFCQATNSMRYVRSFTQIRLGGDGGCLLGDRSDSLYTNIII
jgi:hypothetical protein